MTDGVSAAVTQETLARLMSVIDSAMDAIVTVDESQRVVTFNRSAEKIFGVPATEAIGSKLDRFIPERFRRTHAQHVQGFGRTGVTTREMGRLGTLSGLRADGKEFPIEASISQAVAGGKRYYTVILRDVSERRKLEAQLLQAQKMEGIGRLAGGVAHDFNNLLMAIFNYLDLATRRLEDGHPARSALSHVQEAAQRAATLTRQLLTFARKQPVNPQIISPREVVMGLEPMLRRLLGEDLALRTVLSPETGSVRADSSQLEQVIMNLALNARDAMPGGGNLTIETSNATIDEEYCMGRAGAVPGEHVVIAVTDTGEGMGPEVLARLFEPFFTTKPPGKGTGLGLATSHGIVSQSGGHIAVYSELGRGTCVKVYLARVSDRAASRTAPAAPGQASGGTETVLLAEDNDAVRRLAVESLRAAGYTVLVAENGQRALELAAEHRGPIHILVTDVVMPEMSGAQLVEAMERTHAGIGAVFMSGYTEETVTVPGATTARRAFLAKPFLTDALLRKVRDVLDGAGARRP